MKIEKCKTRQGYKVKPDKRLQLDMHKLKHIQLIQIIHWTPIVAICKYKEVEIIIHRYGELQFKEDLDIEIIRNMAMELYCLMGNEVCKI